MEEIPVIVTERLVLRPFKMSDASEVRRLAGEREIAANTLLIPHPYLEGMAEDWISTHADRCKRGEGLVWAITEKIEGNLLGTIGLNLEPEHLKGELGYWIGKKFWSRRYATEAGEAVVAFAFDRLKLNRIHARHLKRNPASGRVMQKLGMQYEGCLRQDVIKWGSFEDMHLYGILESDYRS